MKNYLLKCDKWYRASQTIYSEGQKVGEFFPGSLSPVHKITLGNNEYTIRNRNVFSNNMTVYLKHKKLAETRCQSFKNETLIITSENEKYTLKPTGWNRKYRITDSSGRRGECHQRITTSVIEIDEDIDDSVVAAIIAQNYSNYEIAVIVACFIPIFIILFI